MMTINKISDEKNLTISLSGRLDTVSAPELEAEVAQIEADASVILDLKDLEYISSAGLRVLLVIQKKMNQKGSFVIRNVNDTVREVLDITGFSDILTIE